TGWDLYQPTSETDPGGLVTTTKYDDAGIEIETDLPHNANNADVRSTATTYYGSVGSGPCVDPTVVGLVCQIAPLGQPSSGSPLPVMTYTYDMYGMVLTQTGTYGTGGSQVTRTSSFTYDAAERLNGKSIIVSPSSSDGTPLPPVSY